MLAFIIPLQSAQVSKSWETVCKLFERCIQSVCNQTVPDFKAIVVCHEKPDIQFDHPNLIYIEVDFPVPDIHTGTYWDIINRKRTDKGRKMLAGLIAARQFNVTHTMFVDADDCVSRRLAQFVKQHPKANGWFLKKGYRHQENSAFVYSKSRDFYTMCGTCNILRYELNKVPEQAEFNRGYGYYMRYIDHAKVKGWMTEENTPLVPLPFAGAIYMTGTGENIFFNSERLYKGVLRLLNYRPLTQAIREEFSLYAISS